MRSTTGGSSSDSSARRPSGWRPTTSRKHPAPVVALRTSPTNIGLQLLGITSAYDLGLLTCGEMIERLEQVFKTLERMRRHRGHFFNWYELEGLNVLQPAYISTVDSGNLAGHFLALKQACREIIEHAAECTRAASAR